MPPPEPVVSVIMIFLDAAQFMDEAIASVVAQEGMDDFELVLCDDGSTDASTGIAQKWAASDHRISYVEHEGHVNRGMSATRNLGLSVARGTFIAFIDADDVWRPRKLAEQVALMAEHPEVGMVAGCVRYWGSWCGGTDELTPTGHLQNRPVLPPEALVQLYPLGAASSPTPSDVLLRKEAVTAVGGFEEQFTGFYEDQAFFTKVYLSWPVYFSQARWLDYRIHPASCSSTVSEAGHYHRHRLAFLTWFEQYLAGLPNHPPREVGVALRRALRPYRRPRLHALAGSSGRLNAMRRTVIRRIRRARPRAQQD